MSCGPGWADRIGSSNLPPPGPPLKGRVVEGDGASTAISVSTGDGATTNAGPTFLERPSAFVDRSLGYAQSTEVGGGRLVLAGSVHDQRFTRFGVADDWALQASASYSLERDAQRTVLSAAVSSARDIEEHLTEVALTVDHTWVGPRVSPYVKAETALLAYGDLRDGEPPFDNQDDRDRISSRVQVGLKWTLVDHVEVEAGAGADNKHYLNRYDDFGLERGSVSIFPVLGFAFNRAGVALHAAYMPFKRVFRDDLSEAAWHHGFVADGSIPLSPALKAVFASRLGFEETDFLIAHSVYQFVALAGLELTLAQSTLKISASDTERTYDGLDVVGLARDDHKYEVAFDADIPVCPGISLTGRVSYMDYRSSFGDVQTDQLTAGLGLTYIATK